MESTFYNWLESILPGSTLILAILLVGGGIIVSLIRTIKKANDNYKEHVLSEDAQKKEYNDLKETIDDIANKITSMNESITKMDEEHTENTRLINERIDEVHASIKTQEDESTDGDEHLKEELEKQKEDLEDISSKIDILTRNMSLLLDSDKESIKSFIATQYYEAMEKQYIEVYIMETLEIRYKKYLLENGDTFVASLMKELRELPHKPPTQEESE